jgi:hypothetical protein
MSQNNDEPFGPLQYHDFGAGQVPAARHRNRWTNGEESWGGWVANTAFVSEDCIVSPEATVFDRAVVDEGSAVFGHARVCGAAHITNSFIWNHAAVVNGRAQLISYNFWAGFVGGHTELIGPLRLLLINT